MVLDEEDDEGLREADSKSISDFKARQEALSLATTCHSMKSLAIATQMLENSMTKLEQHFELDPEKNYTASLKLCCQLQDSLVVTLGNSCLEYNHPRRVAADQAMTTYLELTAKINKPHKVDTKPKLSSETGLGGMKYALHSAPTFSGDQKDFQAFWAEFKQIHSTPHFSEAAKLAYLKQGQLDLDIRRRISENIENGDAYSEVVEKFTKQFDRPREMHRIYVNSIVQLPQVKPIRSAILDCVNTVNSAINGMKRLGQCDLESLITSIVENLLPPELKARWSDITLADKKVPPIAKLLEFLEERADQPQYSGKGSAPSWNLEKKPVNKQKVFSAKKGSVNVTVAQPSKSYPQQIEPQAGRPAALGKGLQRSIQGGAFPIRYTCPECSEAHYAFSCPKFQEKTLAQRKNFVTQQALCFKCLKPGHGVGECRNRNVCRICEGRHHVMLHPAEGVATPPSSVGTINTIHSEGSQHSFTRKKLMQTCELEAAGPTGRKLKVRAFIDEGADSSSITARVAQILQLEPLKQSVEVSAFGDAQQQCCQIANFFISSYVKRDWKLPVSALIVKKIMGPQPRQEASQIRRLVESQGLKPADPNFDRPGKIDVLLGADVIPFIQSRDGATDSVVARETVFGHVFLGTYDTLPDSIPVVSNVQIVGTRVSDFQARDELSVAVTRFWEVEEPPARTQVFSAEEVRVQKHYMSTHRFLPNAGRYEVTLPRKQEAGVLGESKTMAFQRFYLNERSLLRKRCWAEFQRVVKEYLDLAHARQCTPEEVAMASREGYYMPMHCVRKDSSTTTKLRVVFDASARTTSGLSLNDTLAVGPMLHQTLDKILMKFRMYRVALTGDVQKMYREILLAPSDQNFHRFVWRAQVSDPVSIFCMNRVTFGVTSSPYVAVQTLQQAADEFGEDSPVAVAHLKKSFYVDDLLGGADTVAEVVKLRKELSSILEKGGFTLRKFRSSHEDVLREIPQDLLEPLTQKDMVDSYAGKHPKALGLKWDSVKDVMAVDVCTREKFELTKRGLLSDIARTFDVLGSINPVI